MGGKVDIFFDEAPSVLRLDRVPRVFLVLEKEYSRYLPLMSSNNILLDFQKAVWVSTSDALVGFRSRLDSHGHGQGRGRTNSGR